MDGIQTTLRTGNIPKLEEFRKENSGPLAYLLQKYRQWKELKEKEKGKGQGGAGLALSKLAAL